MSLSEQEEQRRKSREEIIDLGIDPYPSKTFKVNAFSHDIKNNFNVKDSKNINLRKDYDSVFYKFNQSTRFYIYLF